MDYSAFVNGAKTKLVSPAGYGKTFTIVQCLKHTVGKQLILTHTHAGVGSIKEKIREAGIMPASYTIETISSFVQQFIHAFYNSIDIPPQEKSKEYHQFIIDKAAIVFSASLIQKVVASSYKGLFVDEYQDCSQEQHKAIQVLSQILPTHIVGDPLQSIFDFNGTPVNMDTDLTGFEKFPDLDVPQRWYKEGNSKRLGDILKEFRELLLEKKVIELIADNAEGFHVVKVLETDIMNAKSDYRTKLDSIITNKKNSQGMDSLLIIVPEYEITKNGKPFKKGSVSERAKLKDRIDYTKCLTLLEAIDDKSFYAIAKVADELVAGIHKARKKYKKIREEILDKLFPAGKVSEWFNSEGLKTKKTAADKVKCDKIRMLLDAFILTPSAQCLYNLVVSLRKELKIKYKREELGRTFTVGLKQSHLNNISVYQAVKDNRNFIRRTGRKVHGKCIGTTLLTKGLEFDTVVLLDAHRFASPEHLYVALTRCCKRLIIFTESLTLSPY
jgi:hypothetical protein